MEKNKNTFRIVSGALFIAYGVIKFLLSYRNYSSYISDYYDYYYIGDPISFWQWCSYYSIFIWIGAIALGVLLIINKSAKADIGAVIAAGVIAVVNMLQWFAGWDGDFYIFDVIDFLHFVGFALLFVAALMSYLNKLTPQLGFLAIMPAVPMAIVWLIRVFSNQNISLLLLLMVAAIAIFGLWLYPDKASAPAPARAARPQSGVGSAEQLSQLKELLDCGAISQEEFDAKKREILGL